MKKILAYINKINLIIYIIAFSLSIVLIGLYFVDPTDEWLALSMSIGASLFGAVILAVAIEISNNVRKICVDKEQERNKIKKYAKNLEYYIAKYIYYFNAISSKKSGRSNIGDKVMIEPAFENFTHIYERSILVTDLNISALERFYEYENQLRDTFDAIHREVEFVYYKNFEEHITQFVKISHIYNVKSFLLQLPSQRLSTGETLAELALGMIRDEKNKIIEDFDQGKYNGNLVASFVILYKMLILQKEILNKIREDFQNIFKEN